MKTKGLSALAVVAILLAAVLAPAMGLSLLNNSNSSVNESESLNDSITTPVPDYDPETPTPSPPIDGSDNNATDREVNETEIIDDEIQVQEPLMLNLSDNLTEMTPDTLNVTTPTLEIALNLTAEPPNEIKELQQWIYKRGYNYTVAENWITRLSPDERKALCGYKPLMPPTELKSLPENVGFRSMVENLESERVGDSEPPVGQPPAYDAMALGYVTPVKDQAGCGSCWIFGATANFESKVAIGETNLLDFSEQEVGDCNIWGRFCNGGNAYMTTNYFSKKGAANELCHSYVAAPQTCNNCSLLKNVDNWRIITDGNGESQIDIIKNAIMDYGPVYASIYASDPEFSYYNSEVYEYWGTESTNHAVEIIGWNNSLTHSHGNGAWMIKNSWGTDWGASGPYPGCAWIAYGVANLGDYTSAISGYNNNTTQVYYHDEYGWMGYCVGYGTNTAWGAVRFTPTQDGQLESVDFWADDVNMQYEIKVFDTISGGSSYTFSNQLGTTQTGSTTEEGYYSIPLDTPIPLVSGDDFIVQVKLTTSTPGWNWPIPIDYAQSGDWFYSDWHAVNSGESYTSGDGNTFSTYSYDIGIRARAGYVAGASTDTWESKLIGTFNDDTNDNFFAEILNSTDAVPNFDGTLTKYAIKVVVTTGKNLDEGEGIEFRHSNNGSTDAVTIGSISGAQLNEEGTYWVNSTDDTVLCQVEHNGVAHEWLHCMEIGDISSGEDLDAEIYVYFEYAPNPPQWSNPNTNKTTIYQNDHVKSTANWTDDVALAGYIFSINQSGAWENSSFIPFSGTFNISENVTQITVPAGTTVGWRFYANDTADNWNATDTQTFVVESAEVISPVTPFMIYGRVFYEDGSECLDPTVKINNTNTSITWQADTNASYNYYRLILDTTNVSEGNVLEFNTSDGIRYNVTNYTVTQENITDGGLFNYNLTVPEPPKPSCPFIIYGWVFYEDGSECNGSIVNVTNTNTSLHWLAETNASYNFYQLVLGTTNISTGNVLEFNVTDGAQFNVTNHTVTQKNITDGGIFDFNLTIGIKEPVNIRNYNNASDLDSWAFSGGMGEKVTVSWQNSSNGTPTCVIWNSGPDGITVCIYAANFTDGDGVQFNPNATEKIVVRDDGNTTPIDWSVVTDYVSNKNESSSSWYNFTLEAGRVRDVYLQLRIPMNVKSGTYYSTFYAKKEE